MPTAEIGRQRQVDDQAERFRGAVGDQRVVHLQGEDEADGQPRGEDDDQREIADRMDLRHDQVGPTQSRRAGAQQLDEERGMVAKDAQQLERAPTEPVDQAGQAFTPKSSASGRAG